MASFSTVADSDGSLDLEAARFIAPDKATRIVLDVSELGAFARQGRTVDHAVVALHPRDERSLESMRIAAESGAVSRLFVLIWWPLDIVRTWLDGHGALDLHAGEAKEVPDPLMVEARPRSGVQDEVRRPRCSRKGSTRGAPRQAVPLGAPRPVRRAVSR